MKILFDNPKKKPWKVSRVTTTGTTLPDPHYTKDLDHRWLSPEWTRNNFVFDGLLRLVEVVEGGHSSWVKLTEEDGSKFNMRIYDFNRLLRFIEQRIRPFTYDGPRFRGQFTFNAVSGSLHIEPYYVQETTR